MEPNSKEDPPNVLPNDLALSSNFLPHFICIHKHVSLLPSPGSIKYKYSSVQITVWMLATDTTPLTCVCNKVCTALWELPFDIYLCCRFTIPLASINWRRLWSTSTQTSNWQYGTHQVRTSAAQGAQAVIRSTWWAEVVWCLLRLLTNHYSRDCVRTRQL